MLLSKRSCQVARLLRQAYPSAIWSVYYTCNRCSQGRTQAIIGESTYREENGF